MNHKHSRSNLPLQLLSALLLLGLALGGWVLWSHNGQPNPAIDPGVAVIPQDSSEGRQEATLSSQPGAGPRHSLGLPGRSVERPLAELELEYSSITELIQDMQSQPIEIGWQCTARLTELDTRDGERVLELHMPAVLTRLHTPQGIADSAALDTALREPVRIRVAADGRILGYRFSSQLRREWRNTLRSLCASLRAPQSGARWEGVEGDAGGMARVVVHCPPALEEGAEREVRWTRSGYDAPSAHGIQPVMKGEGMSLHTRSIFARSSTYAEHQEINIPIGDVRIVQNLRVTSKLLRESVELVQLPADLWEGEWEPASGAGDALPGEEEDDVGPKAPASLAAHIQLLQQFVLDDAKDSPEFYEAFQRLVADLMNGTLDPEEVRRLLMDPALDPELARILSGAAGAAGTPALQNVLVDVARAGQLPLERRSCAVVALVQVAGPDNQAAQGLLALLLDPATDPQLAKASLYMLGAFAGKPGADPALFQQLLALESRAASEGSLQHFLTALGNVGNNSILPTIQRYLEHSDANLRAAALDALRRLESPEAFAILSQHATSDPAPKVRAEALGSLSQQPGELALPLLASALNDASVAVRKAAVQALGGREEPQAIALLTQARDQDPAASVRSLAGKLLQ
jgi:HEAT repeat protein